MTELKFTSKDDDNQENLKLERILRADDVFYILSSIMDILRNIMKYEETSEETYNRFEKFRAEINELMYDKGINLDYYYS